MPEARIDPYERPLAGRGARSLPFGGGCAMALGIVLMAFAAVFAAALGAVLALAPGQLREQRWLVPPALLFVGLLGAGLLYVGVRDRRREARGRRMAALHPHEPWFADWRWDPRGARAEAGLGGATILVALFVLLIAGPFNILWTHVLDPHEERTIRLFSLMVLIPDFFIYLVAKGLVSLAYERLRFGRASLRYQGFPFLLGGVLRARVTARAFAGQEGVEATLRCVDERMVRTRGAGGSTDSVGAYQLYEARQVLPGRFAGTDVALDFALPEGPPTQLRRQPPLYWELEIVGRDPAGAVTFLVPVYELPAP